MNGFLSGLILFSSFAMRTPNDDTIKNDDYELSVGFKSKTIYYKRDWERELDVNYIDEEAWFVFEPNGLPLYMKPQLARSPDDPQRSRVVSVFELFSV